MARRRVVISKEQCRPFRGRETPAARRCTISKSRRSTFSTRTNISALPTEDRTPPVTTPVLPSPTGLNGWYSGPTVLNFKALDDLSGVIRTEVSQDNRTTWQQLPCDGIALNDDGVYTVFFRSKDLAGNRETPKSITVKIDSTAPVTTAQYRVLDRQVSFTATDNVSGVARTEYRLDGSPWIEGTTLIFTSGGLHTILFRSIDVAGNVEKTNSSTL